MTFMLNRTSRFLVANAETTIETAVQTFLRTRTRKQRRPSSDLNFEMPIGLYWMV